MKYRYLYSSTLEMGEGESQWNISALTILQIIISIILVSTILLSSTVYAAPTKDQIEDHQKTAFPLEGAHRRVDCESCHLNGTFKGTPKLCSSCHNGVFAAGKTVTHVKSSDQCEECHRQTNWTSIKFDHSAVTGTCVSCHNGTMASGKSATHIRSTNFCEDCHVTSSWTRARFDHSSVTGSCFSCHNGTTATGKSATHMPTTNTCDD
ncbi:MAG: cytochrome c3 family protein, partial [bacterium]